MVSKKSFTLLVDTGKIPIFTVFSIIFEQDCSGNKGSRKFSNKGICGLLFNCTFNSDKLFNFEFSNEIC